MLNCLAGEAIMGDSVPFSSVREMHIQASGLLAGDVVQVVTSKGGTPLLKAEAPGSMQGVYSMDAPGFAWVQILRSFLPGLPMLPALISNRFILMRKNLLPTLATIRPSSPLLILSV
jgi:hypothetical protein